MEILKLLGVTVVYSVYYVMYYAQFLYMVVTLLCTGGVIVGYFGGKENKEKYKWLAYLYVCTAVIISLTLIMRGSGLSTYL